MKVIREIEFRSDTMTKPTMEMRKAMFNAVVGDDGYGLDPTVKELEQLGAKMLGKEEGLFFPSGVMGNLASVMSHCWERGSEVLVGDLSHIVMYEQGGISTLGNIHSRSVRNTPNGCFDISEMEFKIRPNDIHQPKTELVCIENTHNRCAGAVLPMDFIHKVRDVAKSYSLKTHVDGARIFNASVASGIPVSDIVQGYDSVSICLSKGLGCPVGNLVVGSSHFMTRLKRCRKVLGGQMRQAGLLAATGIVALNSMVDRLADDHRHARLIAEAVSSLQSDVVSVNMKRVQTNIVFLELNLDLVTVQEFCQRFREVTEEEKNELGDDICIMNFNAFGPGVCRLLTHVDVSYEDTLLAIKKIKYVINELEKHPIKLSGTTNGSNGHPNGHTNGHTNGHSTTGSVGYQ